MVFKPQEVRNGSNTKQTCIDDLAELLHPPLTRDHQPLRQLEDRAPPIRVELQYRGTSPIRTPPPRRTLH